jgi:hypothetical protein
MNLNQGQCMKTMSGYAILLFLSAVAYAEPPVAEVEKSDIEYASPRLAIEALRKKPGVEITTEANGWIIASDQQANSIWSFAPDGDPSYPAMVKRTIVTSMTGEMTLEMSVSCGASKEACDSLVRKFIEMNEKAVQ